MSEKLANLLRTIVEVVQNHSTRIEALEKEELNEDGDDANLMEEVIFLLEQLQTPESAEQVPSDQI